MTAPDWLVHEVARSLHHNRDDGCTSPIGTGDEFDRFPCPMCVDEAAWSLADLEPSHYAQVAIDTGGMLTLGTLHRDQDSFEGFRRAEP